MRTAGAVVLLLTGACSGRQAPPDRAPDVVEQLTGVCRCHFERERAMASCDREFPREGPVLLRHSCAVTQDPDDPQQTYCVYEAWREGERLGRVYGWREEAGGHAAARPCGIARPPPPEG